MTKDVEAAPNHVESVDVGKEKMIGLKDVDEALKFLHAKAGTVGVESVDDKKLLRKVDWTMMPLMFLCYFLQYSDKTLTRSSGSISLFST